MKKTRDKFDVLFFPAPIKLLLAVYNSEKETFKLALAKEIDCTYSHVVRLIQLFAKHDIVTIIGHGRKKLIFLTKKGKLIAESLSNIKYSL